MRVKDFRRTILEDLPGEQTIADVLDIMDKIFHIPPAQAIIADDEELDDQIAEEILFRLGNGEPSAYIIGHVGFAGIEVQLNPYVLIPRPETEELVTDIIADKTLHPKRILDICTGSGCIALALKKAFPRAEVVGSDISEEALELARESARREGLNVTFKRQDLLEGEEGTYDLIVSNPPYIPEGTMVECDYEPELALFSGPDGLDATRGIARNLFKCLAPHGRAYFEIDPDHAAEAVELFVTAAKAAGVSAQVEIKNDLQERYRFVIVKLD